WGSVAHRPCPPRAGVRARRLKYRVLLDRVSVREGEAPAEPFGVARPEALRRACERLPVTATPFADSGRATPTVTARPKPRPPKLKHDLLFLFLATGPRGG